MLCACHKTLNETIKELVSHASSQRSLLANSSLVCNSILQHRVEGNVALNSGEGEFLKEKNKRQAGSSLSWHFRIGSGGKGQGDL